MNRYKVGDRVRIINHRGGCWNSDGKMDKWQGKIMTIHSVTPHGYRMVEDQKERAGGWSWRESDFAELITTNYSIHITTDGRVTRAIKKDGKKVIAKAEAICSPTDTFDFDVGAQLAFNRLEYGTDYHPAEVAFKRTKKPKYYTGKVVCVDNKRNKVAYTPGKVYSIIDGYLTDDRGMTINSDPVKSLEEWFGFTSSKFIEFKGE